MGGKQEGRGLVWVEQDNPIRLLDKDSFEPKNAWGELRFGVACVNGMYGPMIIDPPQQGDYRRLEQYISSDVIDHWVLYDVIEPNEDKVTVVYEKKGDCVLVDRMDEVYAQRKKNREERKRRET